MRNIFIVFFTLALLNSNICADSSGEAPQLRAFAAALTDASTGALLYEKNGAAQIPPASLTKLVTTYIALNEAKKFNLSLETPMKLPPESWARNQPPRSSLMWIDDGQRATLRELLLGLAVPSGNDAAIAVALNFAPSVEIFVGMMNDLVKGMALNQTHFVEPSGISEENTTTAIDFAEFCGYYIEKYPENLRLFHSVNEFAYPKAENMPLSRRNNPKTIIQHNHIGLLRTYPGVDGLKTGYIDESGYNVALTAERGGTRFIIVLLGVPAELGGYWGPRYRDADGAALFDWAFSNFKTIKINYPEFRPARIWKGNKNFVPVIPSIKDVRDASSRGLFTTGIDRGDGIEYKVEMFSGITAPIEKGKPLGTLTIFDSKGEIASLPLRAAEDVKQGNIIKRIWDAIAMFFSGAG